MPNSVPQKRKSGATLSGRAALTIDFARRFGVFCLCRFAFRFRTYDVQALSPARRSPRISPQFGQD
jgi:hypothetical protein